MSESAPTHAAQAAPVPEGAVCEELRVQEVWFDGELEDEANAVFLKADGAWRRMHINEGRVYWRDTTEKDIPETRAYDDIEGGEAEFCVRNLGNDLDVLGKKITSGETYASRGGVAVIFRFETGLSLMFFHKDDATGIKTEQK